ncbi:hypothetical protein ScPMuIL_007209 [Solemya velum]
MTKTSVNASDVAESSSQTFTLCQSERGATCPSPTGEKTPTKPSGEITTADKHRNRHQLTNNTPFYPRQTASLLC